MPRRKADLCVLVLAPLGQDAPAMAGLLHEQGITAAICEDPEDCLDQIQAGAGALLLTEEALELDQAPELLESLEKQPAWSELPVIILTSGGESRLAQLLDLAASAAGTVTLLERPMRAATLLRSVQVALRSRRRQYQVRDLLTEQHQQHEQLRQSEERLRLAKQATKLGIYDYKPLTGVIEWDARMYELWGFEPGSPLTVERIFGQLPPEDQPIERLALERALDPAGDGSFYSEHRVIHGLDGRTRWVAVTGHVTFENGRAVRLVGTAQDITHRRQFQTELERLVAERTTKLEELVGELEHFSYTITHDMRAPLRSMRGFAELIEELGTPAGGVEQLGLLRRIIQSAERMDLLITDALSYSKAVRQELPLGPVDLGALLRSMLDSYPELQAAKAHIHLVGELPLVLGNQAGLTQVFSNLLGNAIKFTKPGQLPQVRIYAEFFHAEQFTSTQWVRVWVEDNGIGISKTMLGRVFNLFSRGSKSHEGTGIGLALVRKVVDRMGGRVGVESEEGQGSRFWVELRSGDPRNSAPLPLPKPPPGPGEIL